MLRSKLKVVFMAAGLVLAGCQNASEFVPNLHGETNGAVVGGQAVKPESQLIKMVALVELKKKDKISRSVTQTQTGKCTATFITKNIVLTAAHCFKIRPATGVVKFQADASGQTFSTEVLRYIIHYGYFRDRDGSHDIALIETKDFLPPGYFQTKLASGNYRLSRAAVAAGFGQTHFAWESPTTSGGEGSVLKYVMLKSGFQFLPAYSKFTVSMSKDEGVSLGDSGGPLFVKDDGELVQIGVLHGIYPYSAIYASTYAHLDWIKEKVTALRSGKLAGWVDLSVQADAQK